MWHYLALVSAFCWALIHVFDSFCVGKLFEKPWFGVVTSSIATSTVLVLLPFVDWQWPEGQVIVFAILSGALIQASQAFYFYALRDSEAGIVAAYWNMVPVLLPAASFVLFRQTLEFWQYAGIAILISASVWICLLDSNCTTRWRAFWLMLTASSVQVVALMLMDNVYDKVPFLLGFILFAAGIMGTGLLPLLSPHVRSQLWKNRNHLLPATPMFFAIEIINLLALFFSQTAIDLGDPSLVTAVESTIPGHAFLISLLLVTLGSRFGDSQVKHRIFWKLACVGIMVFGAWLLG